MNTQIRDILAILPDGVRVSSVYIQDGIIAAIGGAPICG
jgi:hypothetical protein